MESGAEIGFGFGVDVSSIHCVRTPCTPEVGQIAVHRCCRGGGIARCGLQPPQLPLPIV